MRGMILAGAVLALGLPASAQCYGTDTFKTCRDSAGNTYTVNKFGNTTMMQGRNAKTGSTWTQNSQTYGNTTNTQGRASNGQSWNMQQQTYGNTTITTGRDSNGKPFSYTQTNPYVNPYDPN
ncbi:hypothetical protein [Hyphomonas sp. CY54-11-8]|jgi:hypothetical protein|uniref:hypothetical protein n=1 Tax=Hyphomonas sp. CY54-11-8 TaxID=1280944 RepID=UPI0004590314|nr:hypothetical protein [Hyphomonas sp. CY54-11-8]KCZ47745.1 hypothetical protein HY17_04515 [Hyphomonas sp. CY54-11-8]